MAIGAALLLWMALWIDRVWGEPRATFHPVVWMGHYLQACGRISTRCQPAMAFLLGAFFWCLGGAAVLVLTWGLQALALRPLVLVLSAQPVVDSSGVLACVGLILFFVLFAWLLKTTFSWRMLRDEILAVETELQQSLEAGRARLSMLVSRDTSQLGDVEVRESAIESLAENLNDSVVAPIFWFLLFGLPGAALYRFANTADAMWGYRGFRHGVRWEWAGKWAAWADDVLSWLPARITAVLLLLAARDLPSLRRLRAEACKAPSPNSGWPMASMALSLGTCLRKPGVYELNPTGRLATAADVRLGLALATRVMAMIAWFGLLLVLVAAALMFFK
ncbi:MAG: adenosylcobinamide-phosphate synthase CbiB [Pseudomonadota bacterium]